jgi:hypothetical protein
MQTYRVILFCLCSALCHAQATIGAEQLLEQAREKYDAPFTRNLQSFDCAVEFSWKDHFKETARVGDEGTDEELKNIFQPIRTRVTVSAQNVKVYSNLSEDAVAKLPHGGMAQFLLEHALERSLGNWLAAATNKILPDAATATSLQETKSGYTIGVKIQNSDVEMKFGRDLRLQDVYTKPPTSNQRHTSFDPGPQGFVLTFWDMGENGDYRAGNRLIFSYFYQAVDNFKLPKHVVVIRESHREGWEYGLGDCSVKLTAQ